MYNEVVSLIEAAAVKVNTVGTFYHGRFSDANKLTSEKPLPQIHLYPFTETITAQSPYVRPAQLKIAFIGKDTADSLGAEQAAIVNEMDALATAFIQALNDADAQFTGEITSRPFFKEFETCSGVFLEFTLVTKYNPC